VANAAKAGDAAGAWGAGGAGRAVGAEGGTGAAPSAERPRRPLGAYLQVLGLTILNPLTIIYFSALALGLHNGKSWTVGHSVVFVPAAFAASACWQSVLAVGGAFLGRALTSPRGRLGSAIVGNVVIVLLAAKLLIS
jgi:arginine exporter protein ArgO